MGGDTGPADVEVLEDEDDVESTTAFDIEDVSTLSDAFGLPHVTDGLTLSVTDEQMAAGLSFELSCAQNWTDYSAGSHVQNSGSD
jgi:hypothetical protein